MKFKYSALLTLLQLFLLCAKTIAVNPHLDSMRTVEKAKQALLFCKQKGYNTRYCILIDMSLSSGVKRFVLWDMQKHKSVVSGLVSHGCGDAPWSGVWTRNKPTFSNADGSHCTALGKYRIDGRGYSNWGIHIKYYLAGLDKTNSNALGRQVVFHSWDDVPENEVFPGGTPEGWGCPAISNNTMKVVDALIRKEKKRLLMWIYN